MAMVALIAVVTIALSDGSTDPLLPSPNNRPEGHAYAVAATRSTHCVFWNPNPEKIRVVAEFFHPDAKDKYTAHDGELDPFSSGHIRAVGHFADFRDNSIMLVWSRHPFFCKCF